MTLDKERRLLTIRSMVLLHNFHTTHVGLNQITRVFNPNYEQNINLDGYGRLNPIYYGGVERHRVLFLFYFIV